MTIFKKRRTIEGLGIILPLFFLILAFVGPEDKGVREVSGILSGTIFSIAVLWLMVENERSVEMLETYRIAAITDPLTRLLNEPGGKRAFERELGAIFRQGHRSGYLQSIEVAVVYIDVDRFKQLNDTMGHAAGDRAIITIAEIIQDTFERATDIVTRPHGDEFVVILPQSDAASALKRVRDELLPAIRSPEHAPMIITSDGKKTMVTLSVGIASGRISWDDSWQDAVDEISTRADNAMYEVKREGGNDVCIGGSVNIVSVDWPEMSPGIMDRQE